MKTLLPLLIALVMLPATMAQAEALVLKPQPARVNPQADKTLLLAATRAGSRLVAVGAHGVILLSDDGGKHFRQARAVPTRVTLTSVSFADAKHGWAAGHWGTLLHSADGGETWCLQRTDTSSDRPLFAVHASDARQVVAVGLWSLLLTSQDGGTSWQEVALPTPPDGGRADRNLYGLFADGQRIYVAAERGLVLRSEDRGQSWSYLDTGYKGSFWAGLALQDGSLLVGGLRGSLYRSADAGRSWQAVESGSKSSITGFAQTADGVLAVGLDGLVLTSQDGGLSFKTQPRDDRAALTAVVANAAGQAIGFAKGGVVGELAATGRSAP